MIPILVSNHRNFDLNMCLDNQNSFKGYEYRSKFSSNYSNNSCINNRGHHDMNRHLNNRSLNNHKNYGSIYAANSYYTRNHGRSEVNMLSDWSSNSNCDGSKWGSDSYIKNHGESDRNVSKNRSLNTQKYGSKLGTDSYIKSHGESDVTMLNNRSSNSHKYGSKRGSNSYHITNNGKPDFNKFSTQTKCKSNTSSSSTEIVNAKNNIEEDSDDSHEDNSGENYFSVKAEVTKDLFDRFPQHIKILKKFVRQKNQLKSLMSYSEIQEMNDINSNRNENTENNEFLNSLPSHCRYVHLHPLKNKTTNVMNYPFPLNKNRATATITKLLSKRSEYVVIREIWNLFRFFVLKDYTKKQSKIIWKNYHTLFKIVHCELELDGPHYRQNLEEISRIIMMVGGQRLSQEIHKKVSGMYEKIGNPPLNLIDSLLVFAWMYFKEKECLSFETVPEIKKAKGLIQYKVTLRNLEAKIGKPGMLEVMSFVDSERKRKIDKSNISSYHNVIRIKECHDMYDLKFKSTTFFPLPLSKIRATALKELSQGSSTVFDRIRENLVIRFLRNSLNVFFTNPKKRKREFRQIWKHYHQLSKLIYIDLGLGKGPAYVDRLKEIMTILEKGQFECIPEELYDDLTEAYKVFSDSCCEEIESLLLLAIEYLEDNNVFI